MSDPLRDPRRVVRDIYDVLDDPTLWVSPKRDLHGPDEDDEREDEEEPDDAG